MGIEIQRRITKILLVILLSSITIFSAEYSTKNLSENYIDTLSEKVSLEIFLKENSIEKLYLVFAGPYPASPTSSFGHLFVLLEPKEKRPFLLWPSLDFSATTDGIGSFEFFLKGIFGGLVGEFRIVPFFEKFREYTFIESRPLWLFPIELNEAEKLSFLKNFFNLQNKSFPYLFANKNCASQIDSIFNISFNKTNISNRVFFFPKTIIDNWKGRIGEPMFVESTSNIINESIYKLPLDFSEENFNLTELSNSEIALLLNFLEWKNSNKKEHLTETEIEIIKKLRILVSKSEEATINIFKNYNKEFDIHPSVLLGGGIKIIHNNSPTYLLNFRLGLHDFFESYDVYPANDYLSLFKTDIGFSTKKIFIDEFYLFNQLSLQPISVLSNYLSWRIGLGLQRKSEYVNNILTYGLFAGIGYSISILKNSFNLSALMEVSPVYLQNYGFSVLFGPELIIQAKLSNRVKLMHNFKVTFNTTKKLEDVIFNETSFGIELPKLNILYMQLKYSKENISYSIKLNHYIN
ncbi:MAG: DUF4105 domain-containing protein [Ignavibacteriae bacterium]|nr:DUF4105 domain-containing protein [Ignavibacteriota bacterium]